MSLQMILWSFRPMSSTVWPPRSRRQKFWTLWITLEFSTSRLRSGKSCTSIDGYPPLMTVRLNWCKLQVLKVQFLGPIQSTSWLYLMAVRRPLPLELYTLILQCRSSRLLLITVCMRPVFGVATTVLIYGYISCGRVASCPSTLLRKIWTDLSVQILLSFVLDREMVFVWMMYLELWVWRRLDDLGYRSLRYRHVIQNCSCFPSLSQQSLDLT